MNAWICTPKNHDNGKMIMNATEAGWGFGDVFSKSMGRDVRKNDAGEIEHFCFFPQRPSSHFFSCFFE